MRARLALLVSGTACELRDIKLSAKPKAMLTASPKGTVPVLVLPDGAVIEQSIDIMRFALSKHDPESWLKFDDAYLIAVNDGPFKHDLDRYKYPDRHDADGAVHREAGLSFLRDLNARLAVSNQLCGATRGIVDVAIMPFVRQFASVDRDWFDVQELPHLKRWLAGHLASELFAAVMLRVEPWSPGDPPLVFADGRGLPIKG